MVKRKRYFIGGHKKMENMRTICFVKQNPQVRIYKQAKALKKTGRYRLILIAQRYDKKLFSDVFDEIIDFGSEYNYVPKLGFNFFGKNITVSKILNRIFKFDERSLARIIKEIDADLFHAHAEPNNIPKIVMENATKPVVFDAYDFSGISSGIENLNEKERIAEKYCLEHADGIVRKGPPLEIEYYRQHGYKIKCPEIQWLDYCDENLFVDMSTKKLSEEDGEVHLVYAGNICVDPKYAFCYFIPLGIQLAKQKIHLHLYSNPYQYATSKEYLELDKKEKYFHFHNPVPFTELSREIAKYDYGSVISENVNSDRFTDEKKKVAHGNKIFGYLEAGLPTIVSKHWEWMKETVEQYKIGFSIGESEINKLAEILKKISYENVVNNVNIARKDLSLSAQSGNLVEFYDEVVKKYHGDKWR
jgi:hypothetical protein